jgi:acyl-CoA dehydrogenase
MTTTGSETTSLTRPAPRPAQGAAPGPAERARAFVDEILIPREVQAERAGGRLPKEEVELIRREALARGLAGGRHAVEHGGQGWSAVDWFLVEEQLGRSTNGLSWHMPSAYNVLAGGSPEQIERYLKPALRGELHDAYAVTEEHAGSDPSGIRTTAARTPSGWRLDGEKWFVTYGDIAAVYIVMALADGQPTLFLVDRDRPGISVVDDPPFTHSYPHGHPTLRFDGVEVGDDAVIGGIGGGDELQRAWFVEERVGIAARGVGAMWRRIEETTAWAIGREQGGARLIDHQGVSFPLADSEVDAAAADGWLAEHEAKALLRSAGLPVVEGRLAEDAEDAVAAWAELGGPVALKLSAPGLRQKTEQGAVRLDLASSEAVRAAAGAVTARAGAPLGPDAATPVDPDGATAPAALLVERMAPPGVELVVAARRGLVAVLVLGLGGVWTEALDDVALVPLPATPQRVERALLSLRGAPLLTGARGRDAVDVAAAARLAAGAGDLLLEAGLELLELNPVIVHEQGAVAVDALARTRRTHVSEDAT